MRIVALFSLCLCLLNVLGVPVRHCISSFNVGNHRYREKDISGFLSALHQSSVFLFQEVHDRKRFQLFVSHLSDESGEPMASAFDSTLGASWRSDRLALDSAQIVLKDRIQKLVFNLDDPAEKLVIFNVHMPRKNNAIIIPAFLKLKESLQDEIQRNNGSVIVVAGDFNQRMSESNRFFEHFSSLGFKLAPHNGQLTTPPKGEKFKGSNFDHVFLRNVDSHSDRAVVNFQGIIPASSHMRDFIDHFPIACEFTKLNIS